MGRGNIINTSPNPSVTIGITLSTSPASLTYSSTEPFYIVVTARILTTPYPEKPITLAPIRNCFGSLLNRSFEDFICTHNPEKKINNNFASNCGSWCGEDLRGKLSSWEFITIPPRDQGVYSLRHEVQQWRIEEARLEVGEEYSLSLSSRCLGALWWCHGSLDELEGVRLRQWRSPSDEQRRLESMATNGFTPEQMERILALPDDELATDELHHHVFEEGPVSDGEMPRMLALVLEGDAVFKIVRDTRLPCVSSKLC